MYVNDLQQGVRMLHALSLVGDVVAVSVGKWNTTTNAPSCVFSWLYSNEQTMEACAGNIV